MAKRARIENRLPEFVTRTERRAATAVRGALTLGGAEAASITPRNSSDLINSQYYWVDKQGSKIVGRTGYTAEYAAAVHAATGKLRGQPRPKEDGKSRGNFWDPSGEPKFLEQGFERNRANILAFIRRAMKT